MSEEKKVRFNNDIETKIIPNETTTTTNTSTNSSNNEQDFEKEILKQIEIGNQKQIKREEDLKKKNKIQDLVKERKYKEEVVNGQIDSVEGEIQYDSDQEEHNENQEKKIFKKVVRARRAFKNDDEYSDDDNDNMKIGSNNGNTDENDDEDDDNNGSKEGKENKGDNEIEIDSFNLESENQDGYFDASGNFIFKKDQGEEDAWLREYDQVMASKVATKLTKRELKRQNDEQTEQEEDLWEKEHQEELKKRRLGLSNAEKSSKLESLNKIYNILSTDKETILLALRRLSGNTGNKRPEIKRKNPPKNKRTTATADTSTIPTPVQSESDKKQFNQLTEIADSLLSNGYMNIYSETKHSINEQFIKEGYQPL